MGRRHIAMSPTMKIIIESTPAKIGRRMKKCEKFMESWLVVNAQRSGTRNFEYRMTKKARSPKAEKLSVWFVVGICSFGFLSSLGFRISSFPWWLASSRLECRFSAACQCQLSLRGHRHARSNSLHAVDHDQFAGAKSV